MKIVFLAVLTDIDKVLRCLTSWCASPSKTSSWRDKYLIIYSTDFFFTCLVFKLSSVGDLPHFMQRHGNLYLSQSQTSWRIIARHTWNNLIFHSCRQMYCSRDLLMPHFPVCSETEKQRCNCIKDNRKHLFKSASSRSSTNAIFAHTLILTRVREQIREFRWL